MKLKLNKYLISYVLLLIVFIVPLFLFKPFTDLNYSNYMGYNNVFENANSIYKMLIIIAFILLEVFVLNINNLKEIKTKKKLFLLNILLLSLMLLFSFISLTFIALDHQGFQSSLIEPPCEPTKPCGTPLDYVQGFYNFVNYFLTWLIIFHSIILFYGIYYLKKANNFFGIKLIKFNASVIIATFFIKILLNVFII